MVKSKQRGCQEKPGDCPSLMKSRAEAKCIHSSLLPASTFA